LSSPQEGPGARSFRSILFDDPLCGASTEPPPQPVFFGDLNLDRVVAAITGGREEYDLKPLFYAPLMCVEAIDYRHDVFRDLEDPALFGSIASFAREMGTMRAHLAQAGKLRYERQKQAWFLDAAQVYCDAVGRLAGDLTHVTLRSRGFLGFREYSTGYVDSSGFVSLRDEARRLRADLSEVRYALHIRGSRVRVSRAGDEPDYGADVSRTFEKFRQGAPREYRFAFPSGAEMNHVEAAVLDRVARLFAATFSSLEQFGRDHRDYLDPTIGAFDREVQFYVACLEHAGRLEKAGLPFCLPTVSDRSKEVRARDTFDLALAHRLVAAHAPVVTNDFHLEGRERIFVVSGPNQGGKTTFARTFGQLHYLASLGCPVPGAEARLFLFDRLFTHFDRDEDLQNLSGKLEGDLRRIHDILEQATPRSILIMNESLSATTLSDALLLSRRILEQVVERDMLCVSVTFLDELATLGDTTVSMVSTVDPVDPAVRTFKVVRRPADGLAYAAVIAEKYHLTYPSLRRRLAG